MNPFPRLPPDQLSAFLSAIRDDPDADGPRLVFADWLDDHGDPRAELIRLDCQLTALPRDDPRTADLQPRLRAWLDRYRNVWPGKHHMMCSCSLERGLLHVHVPAALLKKPGLEPWLVRAIREGWVVRLEVYADPQAEVKWIATRAAGRKLGLQGRLDELPTLLIRIINVPMYLPFLQPLTNLACLDINVTHFEPADLQPLRQMTGMRSLLLGHSSITDEGLAYLDGLKELRRLDLHWCEKLTGAGLHHLLVLTNLTHLDLSGTRVGVADLQRLGALPSLRLLEFGRRTIPADELASLQQSLPGVTIRCGPDNPDRPCSLCATRRSRSPS
jgi:uncharacterized protein (TIGR02996 family)